jgi:hypothetical protein
LGAGGNGSDRSRFSVTWNAGWLSSLCQGMPYRTSCNRPMQRPIYNLEFRPGSKRLEIDGYTFERVANYREQHAKLQFLVSSFGSESRVTKQTGEHSHTANVTVPDTEPASIIPSHTTSSTALDDILLLLQLFTGREVFIGVDPSIQADEPYAIVADPRVFRWGGVLVCSIPYQDGAPDEPHRVVDVGLQVHLPRIYERMKHLEWQRQYKRGYFLVLLRQALQQRSIEVAFGQCWTICEHLFACLTDPWMSRLTLKNISAKEKIALLLIHFGVRVHLEEHEKSRLEDLAAIRNRLVHFGQFPERDAVHTDAEMFIRITEYFAAKALGLFPSDIFNAIDRFEKFLTSNDKKGRNA